ncbi:MAG: segregation/condensation protein A [Halodesulfurarchaeum sp.]
MTDATAVGIDDPPEGSDAGPEPVEVLVTLAEEGEIDPWDIDIIEVTDAFLAAIDEAEIRTSGRALFYASVLLRMKSDELFAADEPDPESEEPERIDPAAEPGLAGGGPDGVGDPIDQLEAEMDRRLERQSARGTPETLDELIRELREAERGSWWKSGRSYDTENSPKGYQRGVQTLDYRTNDDSRDAGEPAESAVTDTAHGEDMDELIASVEAALAERYDRGRPEILFAEIADVAGSRVETFLGLLFLAHRGAVFLDQDELFGDLWIRDRRDGGDGKSGPADTEPVETQ